MKKQPLSNMELSSLFMELFLLMRSGVNAGDSLSLLLEESDSRQKELLDAMAKDTDDGLPLSAAMRNSERFPIYAIGLVAVGEESGHLEEALSSLAQYYEDRDRQDRQVRVSLLYPSLLLVLMLVVIIILLVRVLPVFQDVYASLGGQLTGMAGGLLSLGQALDTVMPILCVLLGAMVIFLAGFSESIRFRNAVLGLWRKHRGDKGISRKMSNAHFAQALAMGMRSGLPAEESVELAVGLLEDTPAAVKCCRDCRARLDEGVSLPDALRESGALPASACRLLSMGMRSGAGDSVMEELARRLTRESEEMLESAVGRVEPVLVLVTSIMVGAILLSVMLPLMNIMTAIG